VNDLTISVVSHGHGALLEHLLADLDACSSLAGTRVLVTLNLRDEPFDAERFMRIMVAVTRNPAPTGFGANHNAAFARCTTRWFAVLNPDLRISADIFASLIAAAENEPRLAAIAPTVVNPAGDVEDHVRTNLTLASLMRRRRGVVEHVDARLPSVLPGPFYWLAGMFILFRSSAYRQVGGFDERYFLYCEDYDICARLYLAGHAIALKPDLRVVHDARRDSHRSVKHLWLHIASLLKVWRSRAFWRLALPSRRGSSTRAV
jgi:hypothetical protein